MDFVNYNFIKKMSSTKDPVTYCPKDCKYRGKFAGGHSCDYIEIAGVPRPNDGGRGCDCYVSYRDTKSHKQRIVFTQPAVRKNLRQLSAAEMEIMQKYIDGEISQRRAFTEIGISRKTFVRIYNDIVGAVDNSELKNNTKNK